MNTFEVYLLMAPLLAVSVGLAIFWLTGRMDRREPRRHPAELANYGGELRNYANY